MDNPMWFSVSIRTPVHQINYAFRYPTAKRLTGKTMHELEAMSDLGDPRLKAEIEPRLSGFIHVWIAAQGAYGMGNPAKQWFRQPWNGHESALEALLAQQSLPQFLKLVRLMEDSLHRTAQTNVSRAEADRGVPRSLLRRFIDRISDGRSH